MKVFDHIWLWLILLFAGYVLIAGSPEERIVRICEPVNWAGRTFESLAMLAIPDKARDIRSGMNSAEKGCQGVIFRQMYPVKSELQKAEAAAKAAAEKAAQEVKGAAAK